MFLNTFKTPLTAAFFCASILVSCDMSQPEPEADIGQCPAPTATIASVQGDAIKSPMRKQTVTVQGIVTLIQSDQGLYIEQPDSDRDSGTSNAIFIRSTDLPAGVRPGSIISARGMVTELGKGYFSLTAIIRVDELIQCATGQALPLTTVTLPLDNSGREALEGMRIQIDAPLVVTNAYQLGRGNMTLSANEIQFTPTEIMAPGPDTTGLLAQNRASALPVMLAESTKHPGLLVSGSPISHITGVMAHDGRALRVSLQSISAESDISFELPASAKAGTLRIVGMNLHNYFNGDGNGWGFPTPRGAKTLGGFEQQRDRIGAAIKVLDPHVLGVMELENDGFGRDSAAADFIQLAHDATGETWAVTRPLDDNTGGDKITVGLFYRSDVLEVIGPAQTLTGPEFRRSRQPLAQVFKKLPDGEKILVVVNHLKSKGSCLESGVDADQKDGQGCWNPMRLASAKKMSAWVKTIAASTGTDNILILGDMNAYRNEDPINAIRDAGFTELMDREQGEIYSFVFFGQHGTLDYAFSSDALLPDVEQAFIWHVNAALPSKMKLPQPWLRFSDHDPVVVDIRSRQSSTSD
jgi:predicted extracellular nuclease